MQIVPVRNVGTKGIIKDTSPVLLTPEAWSDGKNVRFDNASVSKITGHQSILSTTVEPIALEYWNADKSYVYGDAENIYKVTANNTSTEISSKTYDSDGRWQFSLFDGGRTLIVNNTVEAPQYLFQGGTTLADLPGWPANTTAGILRPFKGVLIAGNLTIGTDTEQPGSVRISSLAGPGAVPASWTVGNINDNGTADQFLLSNTSRVTEIRNYRGVGFLFTEDSIHTLRLATENSITRVNNLNFGVGCLAPDCVTEFEGGMFSVDRNDLYVTQGSGGIESVSNHKVREYFLNNLNSTHFRNTFTTLNKPKDEIWVCFPNLSTNTAGSCNEAMIWNYKDNTWSHRDLPNVFSATQGPIPDSNGTFGENKNYIIFNGYRTSNASQQQRIGVTGSSSNTTLDRAASFTWDLSGQANRDTEGLQEVQTVSIIGSQANTPAVVDVQSFTLSGRSNYSPEDTVEIVDFGVQTTFNSGRDTEGRYLDFNLSGSFTSFTSDTEGTFQLFYGPSLTSHTINHLSTARTISTLTNFIDYIVDAANSTTGFTGSVVREDSDTLRYRFPRNYDVTPTGTLTLGFNSFDSSLSGIVVNITSDAYSDTNVQGVGTTGGALLAFISNVSSLSNLKAFLGPSTPATWTIYGPKYVDSSAASGGFMSSRRDTSGSVSFGSWDIRTSNNRFAGSLSYTTWDDWGNNWLFLNYTSDGRNLLNWEVGDLVTVNLGFGLASFNILAIRTFSDDEIYFQLSAPTFTFSIPSGSSLVVRNTEAIAIRNRSFSANADSDQALTEIRSVLDTDSEFSQHFSYDTDTEVSLLTGGFDYTITSLSSGVTSVRFFPAYSGGNFFIDSDNMTIEVLVNRLSNALSYVNKVDSDTFRINAGVYGGGVYNNSTTVLLPADFSWEVQNFGGTMGMTVTDVNDPTNTASRTAHNNSYQGFGSTNNPLRPPQRSGHFASRNIRYRGDSDGNFGDFVFSITTNGGSNTEPHLRVIQQGETNFFPHSTYTLLDGGGGEITTFTSSVLDTDSTDRGTVIDRLVAAANSNVETPINYNATFSGDTVTLTAVSAGASEGNWTLNINHGTAFGGNRGTMAAVHSVDTEGANTILADVNYTFTDPIDSSTYSYRLRDAANSNQIAAAIRTNLSPIGWTLSGSGGSVIFTSTARGPVVGLWTFADSEEHNASQGVQGTFSETVMGVTPVPLTSITLVDPDNTTLVSGSVTTLADSDTSGQEIADLPSLRGDMAYDSDLDQLTFTYDTVGRRGRPTLTISHSNGAGTLAATGTGNDSDGVSGTDILPSIYTITMPTGFTPRTVVVNSSFETAVTVLNRIRDAINSLTFSPADINASVVGNDMYLTWSNYNVSTLTTGSVNNQTGNGSIVFGTAVEQTVSETSTEIHAGDRGNTFNGEAYTAYVEKKNFDMGDLEATEWADSIYPLASGTGNITISVEGSDFAGKQIDLVNADDRMVFDIDGEYKVDPRTNGRFLNIRFESTDNDTWTLDGYSLTVEKADER